MSIVLQGSTSGSVTLQEPAIAGTTVLTLPAVSGTVITTGSSGQSIPKAALPTGSVLQVVNATFSTQVSSSSSTFADTGLSASITPSSATSKILVLVTHNGCRKESSNTTLVTRLLRGATVISAMEGNGGRTGDSATQNFAGSSLCILDSPTSTSALTYKTQFMSTNNTGTVYINDAFDAGNPTVSTMTLMEISA